MWHIPTNPQDTFHSQLERENFLEEQKTKKEFMESVKQMADSAKTQSDIAVKKSKQADIKGWISVILTAIGASVEIIVHFDEIVLFLGNIFK